MSTTNDEKEKIKHSLAEQSLAQLYRMMLNIMITWFDFHTTTTTTSTTQTTTTMMILALQAVVLSV